MVFDLSVQVSDKCVLHLYSGQMKEIPDQMSTNQHDLYNKQFSFSASLNFFSSNYLWTSPHCICEIHCICPIMISKLPTDLAVKVLASRKNIVRVGIRAQGCWVRC